MRMLREVTAIRPLHLPEGQIDPDILYWRTKTVQERLAALDLLREDYTRGLPDAEQRLQRVCRVTQRQRS
jgi:hypothetical protein